MSKQKKHGALFYVLAVIFFPITLTVLIVRLCVRQKEKPPHGGGGENANVIGETIGGKPTIYNGGVNYGGTFKGHGKAELYSIILPTHTKRDISKMTDQHPSRISLSTTTLPSSRHSGLSSRISRHRSPLNPSVSVSAVW